MLGDNLRRMHCGSVDVSAICRLPYPARSLVTPLQPERFLWKLWTDIYGSACLISIISRADLRAAFRMEDLPATLAGPTNAVSQLLTGPVILERKSN